MVYELFNRSDTNLNYPDVYKGTTAGSVSLSKTILLHFHTFFFYYFVGEVCPSAMLLYLTVVLHFLEIHQPMSRSHTVTTVSNFAPEELIDLIKRGTTKDVQTYLDSILAST